MKPVVILDRDGTIIADKHYLKSADEVELLPHAAQALTKLRANGFELIVITNQSGIGRGYFSVVDMQAVNRRMCELLAREGLTLSPDAIYYCPHAPEDNCLCRKPLTTLAQTAQNERRFDLKRGFVIGDKKSDLELGYNLGLPAVLVRTGYGMQTEREYPDLAAYAADDLDAAADWITGVFSPHC